MDSDKESISRGEYEARHAELTTRVLNVEAELYLSYQRVAEENKAIRDEIQAEFIELRKAISGVQISTWKLLTLCIINFLVGGGVVEILTKLH